MLNEALKDICTAENDARQKIMLARENAGEAIENAHVSGKNAVALSLARAQSEIAYFTHEVDNKATQEAKELASTTANRQATLYVRAENRLEAAANLIVERIVSIK